MNPSGRPLLLSWSSGKDSAWALHELRRDPRWSVAGLLCTVNAAHDRVAMHAVRRRLLELQARAVGLPLRIVEIPDPCTDADYAAAMGAAMAAARDDGIEAMAFGDLFLEDIRAYREQKLAPTGLEAVFPLWGRDTTALSREMLAGGLCARLTCVDARVCPPGFAGRDYDAALLDALPPGVDPCGENGEFHSFVWDGPMFDVPVPVRLGEVVERGGFVFADLLPGPEEVPSPCVGDCTLRPWRGPGPPTCKGCERNLDEIVGWPRFDDETRRAVWRRLRGVPRGG